MRDAVKEMRKPNGENIFHKLLFDKRKKETPNPNAPKVGYVMNSYVMLDDEAFSFVASIPFTPFKPTGQYKCDACGKNMGSVYHEQDCSKCAGLHKTVHDLM
jgi:hypothetical protein